MYPLLKKYTLDVTEDNSPHRYKYTILLWADAFTCGGGKSDYLLLAFWRAWKHLQNLQKRKNNCPVCGKYPREEKVEEEGYNG